MTFFYSCFKLMPPKRFFIMMNDVRKCVYLNKQKMNIVFHQIIFFSRLQHDEKMFDRLNENFIIHNFIDFSFKLIVKFVIVIWQHNIQKKFAQWLATIFFEYRIKSFDFRIFSKRFFEKQCMRLRAFMTIK